jgi:hypothetical protein
MEVTQIHMVQIILILALVLVGSAALVHLRWIVARLLILVVAALAGLVAGWIASFPAFYGEAVAGGSGSLTVAVSLIFALGIFLIVTTFGWKSVPKHPDGDETMPLGKAKRP